MNKKLTNTKLLDENGNLYECGYTNYLIKEYVRTDVKASKWRIKEWDYYLICDDNYGVAMTIDDNGYMGLCSFSILDFTNKKYLNKANLFWFPFGKVKMPSSSKNGDVRKNGKTYDAYFKNDNGKRVLEFNDQKVNGKSFNCKITLEETSDNSMVIATPFNKKKHFYYNQKINNLKASGSFSFGDFTYTFNDNAYGVLDWGRGVWTYKNTWYWSSLSGKQGDDLIGFNLGYGFGDTSSASENMLFVNDKYYKFNDVIFDIPKINNKDYFMNKWHIYSKNYDIDLIFEPIIDRHDKTDVLIIGQDAHQVFGYFSGHFKNDEVDLKIEKMLGFAEKVSNKW